MKNRKRTAPQRPTFNEICAANRPRAERQLTQKARRANALAKLASRPSSRAQAYAAKAAALNQGITNGLFCTRSDEQGRNKLLRVRDAEGRELHLPRRKLSEESLNQPSVRALLGLNHPKAA